MEKYLGMPLDASAHGHHMDSLIVLVHWLMLVLFVGWGIFFVYTLIRFRSSRNPKADHAGVQTKTSTYIEVGVAVFEGVLLIGFAIPLWADVVEAFPDESESTVVRVVAEQFAWNAHYAGADGVFGRTDITLVSAENPIGLDRSDPAGRDDIATINQLNLPVGKPVIVYLTTKDVIHSFAVPLLRVKHDAIPGEQIPLWFTPVKTTKEIQESLQKIVSIADGKMTPWLTGAISMAEYADKEGNPILRSGDYFSAEVLVQLKDAGVQDVLTAPATPIEIACAQLCGLGHYRMRGFVSIQTPEEFQAWLEEEASYLE